MIQMMKGDDGDDENSSDDETGANSNLDPTDLLKDACGLFFWTENQLELMNELHVKSFGYQVETRLELCKAFIFCKFTAKEFT